MINPGEKSQAVSRFEFLDTGTGTVVNWSFEADYGYNLVGRFTALLLNGVIRRDYEHGLRQLAELAESLPRADFSDLDVQLLRVEARDIAFRPAAAQREPAAMAAALGDAYFRILNFIDAHALQTAGAPLSIIRTKHANGADIVRERTRLEAGVNRRNSVKNSGGNPAQNRGLPGRTRDRAQWRYLGVVRE